MRAGPSGEEWGTPHYTVPVYPQCPQETGLLTLPVFQGAVVSSEHFSQFLPPGSQESKRRPVTHCQSVSKTVGSDISCVQHDTFWPAVHETPTVVAQDQGVLPKGKTPLHDQGHSWLFCSLAIAMLFHTRQGFASLAAWISRSPGVFDAARVPGGERLRLCV